MDGRHSDADRRRRDCARPGLTGSGLQTSNDLRDLVGNSAFDQISGSDADDVVQPRVFVRAGLEQRIGPEIIARGIDLMPRRRVAHRGAQFGRRDPAAAIAHMHQRIVVGAQRQADVQRHRSVGPEQCPVAAAFQHVAAQSGSLERSACRAEQDPPPERAIADIEARLEVDDDIEEMLRLDLGNGFRPWVCHRGWPPESKSCAEDGRLRYPAANCGLSLPNSVRRTASVETPDWAQSAERSKKKRSLAIRSFLNVNWMNSGSSARRPLGTTPNRSPVMVICTVPQQIRLSSLFACPCSTTL